jgi:hypothetical protein
VIERTDRYRRSQPRQNFGDDARRLVPALMPVVITSLDDASFFTLSKRKGLPHLALGDRTAAIEDLGQRRYIKALGIVDAEAVESHRSDQPIGHPFTPSIV